MATRLQNLKITSTDLVDEGANPHAYVRLFKRKDEPVADENDGIIAKLAAAIAKALGKSPNAEAVIKAKGPETFNDERRKEQMHEVAEDAWGMTYMFSESLCSIICAPDISADERRNLMFASLDQFVEAVRERIPLWADGKKHGKPEGEGQSAEMAKAFKALMKRLDGGVDDEDQDEEPDDDPDDGEEDDKKKEEIDTMKIDKSKMSPEDIAALEAIEKKYSNEPQATELHPDVKKALEDNAAAHARIAALEKSLEIKDLATVAKKYEVLGKDSNELAEKLYNLKKSGGTAFEDFTALLDEQMTLVEKSGIFTEIGKSATGDNGGLSIIDAAATEMRKSNPGLDYSGSIVAAFRADPAAYARYEADYARRMQ